MNSQRKRAFCSEIRNVYSLLLPTALARKVMQSPPSVRLSDFPSVSALSCDHLLVCRSWPWLSLDWRSRSQVKVKGQCWLLSTHFERRSSWKFAGRVRADPCMFRLTTLNKWVPTSDHRGMGHKVLNSALTLTVTSTLTRSVWPRFSIKDSFLVLFVCFSRAAVCAV